MTTAPRYPRYRALPLGGSLAAHFAQHADGTMVVTSTEPLQPTITTHVEEWRNKVNALETMRRPPVSQGVLNYTATDHFGYTPETGVMLKIVGGEWQVVPN